jgi:hypothetical protein
MNIWRLNVKEAQITECIRSKKFAFLNKPRNPEIQRGDMLLLQLVEADARRLSKSKARIEFALVFDHYEEDYDGSISRYFWPNAGRTWRWVLHCSDIIPTIPFSLSSIDLHNEYSGQANPRLISLQDALKITPYLMRYQAIDDIGTNVHRVLEESQGERQYKLWASIRNTDRIVEQHPDKIEWRVISEHKEIKRNPELPCLLKELYDFKCQICKWDFKRDYGTPYSETHHMIWLSRGGIDHSNNLVVVCPNHHRIIHETQAFFDRIKKAFVYPNGFSETLQLIDHLKDPALLETRISELSQLRETEIIKERTNQN